MLGFHTIVVGVDGSEESLAALTQARRLLGPEGRLVAVVVGEERLAFQAGFDAPRMSTEIQAATPRCPGRRGVLLADVPGAEVRLAHGRPAPCLLEVAKETGADLLAVGSYEHSRVAGILFGSVATRGPPRCTGVGAVRPAPWRHLQHDRYWCRRLEAVACRAGRRPRPGGGTGSAGSCDRRRGRQATRPRWARPGAGADVGPTRPVRGARRRLRDG